MLDTMLSAALALFVLCLLQFSYKVEADAVAARRPCSPQDRQSQDRYACPSSMCCCRWRRGAYRMRCHYNRRLPQFADTNVIFERVSFGKQNITHLPANAFRHLHTRQLDLHGNALASNIDEYAFVDVATDLYVLVLSQCNLSSVPMSAIARLNNLRVLRLEENSIENLGINTFEGNPKLIDLSLYSNKIRNLQTGTFYGLTALQHLKLFNNEIGRLRRAQLRGLEQLASLDLSRNHISRLQGKVFKDLKRLTWLDLESNRINSLSHNVFKGLRRLKNMNLARNCITQIADYTFSMVTSLRYLAVDIGNVTNLSNLTFTGMKKLTTLHLGEVKQLTFPRAMFGDLDSLKLLTVSDNETFRGFEPGMFSDGFSFSQLQVWTNRVKNCTCKTRWIRKLTKRGAYVHGYCHKDQPIGCRRKRKEKKRKEKTI